MAYIQCTSCTKTISDKSKVCPYCGATPDTFTKQPDTTPTPETSVPDSTPVRAKRKNTGDTHQGNHAEGT